jgi:glycosyltransferase involved in cell wall biosynthesis
VSLAVCTHNPRADYLEQVVAAIKAQTVRPSEVLIVDNASDVPVETPFRTTHEPVLGLVHARTRAISASTGDVIIFIDDDNVVANDYVENAIRIAIEHPRLGCWGPAILRPQFQREPSPAVRKSLGLLGLRDDEERWANLPFPDGFAAVPYGAGLCVRRPVAERWLENLEADAVRRSLGAVGSGLGRCEDIDLVYSAPELGFGFGIFRSLMLTHLMPAERIEPEALLRLAEGHEFSFELLRRSRGAPPASRGIGAVLEHLAALIKLRGFDRRMYLAKLSGVRAAARVASQERYKDGAP